MSCIFIKQQKTHGSFAALEVNQDIVHLHSLELEQPNCFRCNRASNSSEKAHAYQSELMFQQQFVINNVCYKTIVYILNKLVTSFPQRTRSTIPPSAKIKNFCKAKRNATPTHSLQSQPPISQTKALCHCF